LAVQEIEQPFLFLGIASLHYISFAMTYCIENNVIARNEAIYN